MSLYWTEDPREDFLIRHDRAEKGTISRAPLELPESISKNVDANREPVRSHTGRNRRDDRMAQARGPVDPRALSQRAALHENWILAGKWAPRLAAVWFRLGGSRSRGALKTGLRLP